MNKFTTPQEIEEVFDKHAKLFDKACSEHKEASFLEYERSRREIYGLPEYKEAHKKYCKHIQGTISFATEEADDIGDIMTFKEFKDCVESGGFMDYDGDGVYMTDENTMTDIPAVPSHIKNGFGRTDMPYVMWYNR